MPYKLTDDAIMALDAIAHYISEDNEKAAERVVDKVLETCALLADMPHLGRHPSYIPNDEICCYPVKKYQQYLVFYYKRRKEIVVIDVIHGARDLPSLFSE